MKKAKIFLSALTVLAIVGGALAFKAKTPKVFGQCKIEGSQPYFCSTNTTLTRFNTTDDPLIGQHYDFDLTTKPCIFENNTWTCTTLTTPE